MAWRCKSIEDFLGPKNTRPVIALSAHLCKRACKEFLATKMHKMQPQRQHNGFSASHSIVKTPSSGYTEYHDILTHATKAKKRGEFGEEACDGWSF